MTETRPARTRLTRVASAGVAVLLAVALSGCLKLDMRITLDADRASGEMIMGLDKNFLSFIDTMEDGGDGPSAADQFLDNLLGDDLARSEGVTVEAWEDENYSGARYIFDSTELADFQETGGDDLAITYDATAGTYEVTGSFDMRELADDPEANEAEDLGMPPELFEQMLESFDISISITFPGEVIEHNGELSDTTVTWRPQVGEENEIYALAASAARGPAGEDAGAVGGSSGGSTSLTTALLVALGALVLATAVILGVWFARRNRQPAAAVVDSPTAEQPLVGYQAPPAGSPPPPPSAGPPPPPGGSPQPPPGSGDTPPR